MAQVDFTNARLTPLIGYYSKNPFEEQSYLSIKGGVFTDSNNNMVVNPNSASVSVVSEDHDEFVLQYTGTFTTSGTEFYIHGYSLSRDPDWKVDNISFSSGDTYSFSLKASMTVN